ncbi:MAG: dNTP triphosphohydrolase [Planctomycetota bacterium]|nr:dNTP triphosphohydrolase [Planctomycetota bacterium]
MPAPHLFDRQAKEAREASFLAPYAMRSADSLGRRHPQASDPLRTCWERDRDRITHSMAFRRLRHKAQVFVSWEGDHNRTRLSHSLEVCQVARSVGNALYLNEALCEALALAHDIGHPPFGHRGEWALDELMKDHGGFRHNAQVLRVVDLLERRTPDNPGLNLTREVRESLLKHEKREDWPDEFGEPPANPILEAQVVDLADSVAYNAHDVDDGLRTGIFTEELLHEESALWRRAKQLVEERCPGFLESRSDIALANRRVVNDLLRILIKDLILETARRLEEVAPESPAAVRAGERRLAGHGKELRGEVAELHRFLFQNFYRHEHMINTAERAAETLGILYHALLAKPDELPEWYQGWIDEVGAERAVCDYIAGMTDSFADSEAKRLG